MRHAVEDILRDYPNLPKYIKRREQELTYPTPDQDDNVGGGRAENKPKDPTGQLVITISDDERLCRLKREYMAITECLDESGSITVKIIQEVYFKKYTGKKIAEMCDEQMIPVSTTKAYDLRNKFLERLTKKLGLSGY